MKRFAKLAVGFGLFLAVFALPALLPVASVGAVDAVTDACSSGAGGVICDNSGENIGGIIPILIDTLLFIVGILSVIMIIVGGLRYTTSAGDSQAVTGAKNTILFAVIGLVVSLVAYALVHWVFQLF